MAAAEQFSLRWNNFQSNMTSGFHSLWEGEDLVDVTLAADGRFLQAHKVVLSVCSPYFKTLFKVNPCKHPIVILKDVGYKDLEALLQFMYRGEVNVCQEELPSFLKTAEMLEVKGLTGEDSQRGSSPSQPTASAKLKERERVQHLSSQESATPSPPIKRKRTACPVSPIVIGDDPSSRGSHGEFSELAQPKVEPTDIETEDGTDDYNAEKDPSESLATLLGGESSHGGMHTDSLQGLDAGMFSNLSSHPVQDSGGSGGQQDSSQGNENPREETNDGPAAQTIYRHSLSILNSSRGVGILKKNISNQLWRSSSRNATSEYRCSLCQKTFTRRDHLRTHERNLHGQDAGPFTCVICMQLYKNADSLRKHVTKYHYSRESASSTMTDVPS